MASSEIDDFLSGPLVTWFISCLEDPDGLTSYKDLVDGMLLHSVFLQIEPEPQHDGIIPSCGNIATRIKNLNMIVENMKEFYEEKLGLLVIKFIDTVNLGKEPEMHVEDMKLLLILLLGCAVQCPSKQNFIHKITTLDQDTQLGLVTHIKEITDSHEIVITQNVVVNVSGEFLMRLRHERDIHNLKLESSMNEIAVTNDVNVPDDNEGISNKNQRTNFIMKSDSSENHHHHAVEVADLKSKLRKQRNELDEKTEALVECKEELEHNKIELKRLMQENQELVREARQAKTYCDELDAATERADRADRLEREVARYREKVEDLESLKRRIEELQDNNRTLNDTHEMLEQQLNSSRQRANKVRELEKKIVEYKQLLNNIALERAADEAKYQELCEENAQLLKLKKAADDAAARAGSISESEEPVVTSDNRLSEQLTNNAQTRALKLELENRRLTAVIESLKDNSFHETSSRVLELEKEKKKLSLKIESMNESIERSSQQNANLESAYKQALEENKKLQNTLKNQRILFERQQQDYQTQHSKMVEMEKKYNTTVEEKQRVQSLLESVQRRADELDRSLEIANQKLEESSIMKNKLKDQENKCQELEVKIASLEKDKDNAVRDVHKYRELIEEKDVSLDKSTNTIEMLKKKIGELEREFENSVSQITRLQEIERSSKELDSQAAIDKETLETLQSNLIAEKMNTQQLQTALEKLGLDVETLLSLAPENISERLVNLPEVVQYINKLISNIESQKNNENARETKEGAVDLDDVPLKEHLQETIENLKKEMDSLQMKLNTSQTTADLLLEEQAKLQVSVTTLQSKNTSLNAQHTALQLANSQLVAEKEELLKERDSQQRAHQQLLQDQLTLQSLHEQLNNEYENLLQERETLKANLRDVKNSVRTLRENYERLEAANKLLLTEQEATRTVVKSLDNLRGEHSKLKDDFRNLYTASEKVKREYRNLQEDHCKNKFKTDRLSLKITELEGELNIKEELCSNLELQISKLNQRCEMLVQVNSGLDDNRRSLMEHVSALLNQYQDLLTRSLEDKEHFHMEEKIYRDQVNELSRQKEKLAEKIIDYYRNIQTCSTKKKRFGAGLVERVRKVGSELLNKNRHSWTDDTKQSDSKIHESESGGNDSDISADERRANFDPPDLENDSLSLGHPGTRRTVYYTDDSPSPATSLPSDQKLTEPLPQSPTNVDDQSGHDQPRNEVKSESLSRPFLIYNKVSAVINESKGLTTTSAMDDRGQNDELVGGDSPPMKESKVGNSIWYEYGCV